MQFQGFGRQFGDGGHSVFGWNLRRETGDSTIFRHSFEKLSQSRGVWFTLKFHEYNYSKIHKSLRMAPTITVVIAGHVGGADIVNLISSQESKEYGLYK